MTMGDVVLYGGALMLALLFIAAAFLGVGIVLAVQKWREP